jgi:hypothetical protein
VDLYCSIARAIRNAKDDASTGDTAWVNSKDSSLTIDNEAIDAGSVLVLDSLLVPSIDIKAWRRQQLRYLLLSRQVVREPPCSSSYDMDDDGIGCS